MIQQIFGKFSRKCPCLSILFLVYVFGGLSVVATPLIMPPIFVSLRDVWIRTRSVAVASRRATNLANHLILQT
jgi:hypothetical protein